MPTARPLTGKGVSVGVIDSGVDPTHPYFKEADGSSAVVANLKALCDPFEVACSVQRMPSSADTDTLSAGGHGTHVNGIVAGRPTTLSDGSKLQGAAPGAKLVSVSTGAGLVIIGADAALNWVLENHAAPCGAGVSATTCPPIKVTNNSYGPMGGGDFDPQSATVKLQRALAADGVVTVWANGNDGGDGSTSNSNPPGMDPTGGILSVASYNDLNSGTRDGKVSTFSSRGRSGDQSTYPDISAPGDKITSSCRPYLVICSTGQDPRNGPGATDVATFNTISGTSMAAPHIAGIVAQLFQANPAATPAQVENALKTTADQSPTVRRTRAGRSAPPASTRATAWSTWWPPPLPFADAASWVRGPLPSSPRAHDPVTCGAWWLTCAAGRSSRAARQPRATAPSFTRRRASPGS